MIESSNNNDNSSKILFNYYQPTIFKWTKQEVIHPNYGYSWKKIISLSHNLKGFTYFKYHIKEQLSYNDPYHDNADHKRQKYLFGWRYQDVESTNDESDIVWKFNKPP